MKTSIENIIKESLKTKERMLKEPVIRSLEEISKSIISAYKNSKRVFVFGNGGSAADAQHFVTELMVRFEKNRASLPALAFTVNTSLITACANDFSFDDVFKKQVEAFVKEGDIVVGISTSGTSANVIKALVAARKKDAVTIGFTGLKGELMKESVDLCFIAPNETTARVQECHILAIHIICKLIEGELFA